MWCGGAVVHLFLEHLQNQIQVWYKYRPLGGRWAIKQIMPALEIKLGRRHISDLKVHTTFVFMYGFCACLSSAAVLAQPMLIAMYRLGCVDFPLFCSCLRCTKKEMFLLVVWIGWDRWHRYLIVVVPSYHFYFVKCPGPWASNACNLFVLALLRLCVGLFLLFLWLVNIYITWWTV